MRTHIASWRPPKHHGRLERVQEMAVADVGGSRAYHRL